MKKKSNWREGGKLDTCTHPCGIQLLPPSPPLCLPTLHPDHPHFIPTRTPSCPPRLECAWSCSTGPTQSWFCCHCCCCCWCCCCHCSCHHRHWVAAVACLPSFTPHLPLPVTATLGHHCLCWSLRIFVHVSSCTTTCGRPLCWIEYS